MPYETMCQIAPQQFLRCYNLAQARGCILIGVVNRYGISV